MRIVWGWILIGFTGILCWGGQVLNALAPALAERIGLSGSAQDEHPVFYADGRAEAIWDAMSLWVLPLAGVLLVLGNDTWAIPGLVGGGMYVYFGGRGLVARRIMREKGVAIGTPETVRLFCTVLALWGITGLVTAIMACLELASR